MIRFLAGLDLLLVALALSLALVFWATELRDAAVWWRAAQANEAEWRACETKHESLKRQIRREGLWKRLGLPAQPWFQ